MKNCPLKICTKYGLPAFFTVLEFLLLKFDWPAGVKCLYSVRGEAGGTHDTQCGAQHSQKMYKFKMSFLCVSRVQSVESVESDAESWAGPGAARRVPLLYCHSTATVTEPLERNRDVIHPTVLTRAFMNFISTIYCPINKM